MRRKLAPRDLRGRALVVASHNPGKAREIAGLLEPLGIPVVSAAALALAEPEETGRDFRENAILKARAAAEQSGEIAIADDSGLAVEALSGAPGLYSARWAGPGRDFGKAMARVERALRERGAKTPAARRAAFVSALAIAWPDGHAESVEGRVSGHLVWPPRGTRGFGYDPIFVPDGCDETFGELDESVKSRISHRAVAFRKLLDEVIDL